MRAYLRCSAELEGGAVVLDAAQLEALLSRTFSTGLDIGRDNRTVRPKGVMGPVVGDEGGEDVPVPGAVTVGIAAQAAGADRDVVVFPFHPGLGGSVAGGW
jgi:hypothetical protein